MTETAVEAAHLPDLRDHATSFEQAIERLRETTAALVAARADGRTDLFLANSVAYLDMCGHTVVAWMWLRMALVSHRELPGASGEEAAYHRGKLRACRFFFAHWLPRTVAQAALLQSLDDTCLTAPADEL